MVGRVLRQRQSRGLLPSLRVQASLAIRELGAAVSWFIITMGLGGMPPKAAKKAKKEKKPKKEGGGKRKKKRTESYSIYIYKVLRCTPTPASPPRACPS